MKHLPFIVIKSCLPSFFIFIFSLFTVLCSAQYKVLVNFNGSNGNEPNGSLTLVGNVLYGTTWYGSNIFSIDTGGNNFKDLADLNRTNGAGPSGTLKLSGSKLYGMAGDGGLYSHGTIFSIDTNGNTIQDIFDFDGYNGLGPNGSLTISGKMMFGMTAQGIPPHQYGDIFSINTNGSNFKVLFNFADSNGFNPAGDVTLLDKVLYGMTSGGGPFGGVIFRIDTDGSNYKIMYYFNGTNGGVPFGSLTLLGNVLYGMTTEGGSYGTGVIFSIDTDGSNYKDLWEFNGTNGFGPQGDLTLSGRKLFGMTYGGGPKYSSKSDGFGCIFSVDTDGTNFKDLYYFDSIRGEQPMGNLTISGSVLYGMAFLGGANGDGVVFKLDTSNIPDYGASINEVTMISCGSSVFPNPNDGIFEISFSNIHLVSVLQIEIYNILGEKVLTSTLPLLMRGGVTVSGNINLSAQPNGIYFYRVLNENSGLLGSGKVIIQK